MGRPSSAISIVAVDGLLSLPDVRSSDLTLVQRNGLYPGTDYMNGRSLTLTLEVYGRTREEFTEALNGVMAAFRPGAPERPLHFKFPGVASDRVAFVKVRTRKRSAPLDLNFAFMVCNVVVELFATDPHVYSWALDTQTLASGLNATGPKLTFTYTGSVPANPVIKVESAKDSVLRDEITGRYFGVTFDGTMTIDADQQRVTSSAGVDLRSKITAGSIWPEFEYGPHRLTLSTTSTTTAAKASMTFRSRWT